MSLVGYQDDDRYAQLPCTIGATIKHGDSENGMWNADDHFGRGESRSMALFTQYAMVAAQEALQDAGWQPQTMDEKCRSGVCFGSGIGNFHEMYDTVLAYDKHGTKKVNPLFVPRLLINMAAGHISMKHGFLGVNHAVSTACTTGNHAIGDAARFIQYGDADVMVAGGSEACIHPLAIAGFARAKALATLYNDDPEAASRPFDQDRCGFVMGEGAGALILEELEHAKSRNATIYAEVAGYGLAADAHHMTAPPTDGSGAKRAMHNALKRANVRPEHVDYINAHATSTLQGDVAENRAIKSLLGEYRPVSEINISSTKGAIGHLLGAAGAAETIFTILAIKHNILPPTLNLESLEAEFDCNYIPKVAQEREIRCALTNSFGYVTEMSETDLVDLVVQMQHYALGRLAERVGEIRSRPGNFFVKSFPVRFGRIDLRCAILSDNTGI